MSRLFRFALAGLGVLAAVVLLRASTLGSRQVRVEPAPPLAFDRDAAVERFAAALRFRTISEADPERIDWEEFRALHAFLAEQFPRVHQTLGLEKVNDYTLVYRWQGTDPALQPAILLSHQDVVPVEPGTEDRWVHPPYSGRIADGYVWGRGALDDKFGVVAILEAAEVLLAEGFQPRRTFYFVFGHDEEVGGMEGARRAAEVLAERGVRAEFVLDEGGSIVLDALPGIDRPLAMVGTAEKGYVSLALSVEVEGGHSSTPPEQTAIGVLSAAVTRVEGRPMPMALTGTVERMIDFLGPEMPLPHRLVLANLWLTQPLLSFGASRVPALAATLRTTTAVTMIEGGVKENVLPSTARAVVNFRILPGETVEDVKAYVRRAVDDERVRIDVYGVQREPTAESPVDVESFAMLQRTIGEIFPDAAVAPYLVLGGTDARHFQGLSANVYRFTPIVADKTDLPRMHGTDERMSIENYGQAVEFFARILRNG